MWIAVRPRVKVLIIDDEPMSARLAGALMRNLGHEVITADGAEEGRRRLEESPVSLILVDWEMPGMNGIEFCRWVRSRSDERYVYLMVMSGHHGAEAVHEATEAGADDYICKPLQAHELGLRVGTAGRIVELEREEEENRRLIGAYDRLATELNRTMSDLDMASRLQQSRLPRAGRFGDIDVCGFLRPVMYSAGDVFDYFEIGEDLFCFYLADVVGHGMTSAMTSYAIRQLMGTAADSLCRRNLERCASVDEMITHTMQDLNRSFYLDEDDNQWFTMILGVVEQGSGRVSLCQGGHPPAIHVSRADESVTRIGSGGFSVSMFEHVTFLVEHCTLRRGDRLVLYSDGLLDRLSDRGDAVATRILETRLLNSLELPFEQLKAEIRDYVFEPVPHVEPTDDISLVVLEYCPANTRTLSLDIVYDLDELARVEGAAEAMLEASPASVRRAGAITLAISEAVCNAIRHGGPGHRRASIRIEMQRSPRMLRIDIVDHGPPMPDALCRRIANRDATMPDVRAEDIEGLPVSGLGIGIILSAVADIDYVSGERSNRLSLVFEL